MVFKLGVIVNSYAGIGGSVGLKGSDGELIRTEAFARGAQQRAPERIQRTLEMLKEVRDQFEVYAFAGEMGETAVKAAGLSCKVLGAAESIPSRPQDTISAAIALAEAKVDLILFAGGDGTARNLADALEQAGALQQTVLGVPSGVKMHSGVYANTPEAAGEILRCLLARQMVEVQSCEVRDIDEEAFRIGKVKTRLYAHLQAPQMPQFLQQVKNSGAHQDELVKLDIANYLIDNFEDDVLYIVGPGSTTQVFMEQLGLQGTLLGVDLVINRDLLAADVSAEQLGDYMSRYSNVRLIVTAIGGQGHIIGRGNQQLASELLKKIPRSHIQIIATKEKIYSLQGRPLLVDSNDPDLDKTFSGYQSVLVGYDEFILYPIGY